MIAEHTQAVWLSLWSVGVRHVVVSPGSRSTPLVLAALQSPLTLHSAIDERSAAFFALGIARASSTPVALVCTSGTAVAHYLPAFLEAARGRHKLIALSADRPFELHYSDANQTISHHQILQAACGPALQVPEPGHVGAQPLVRTLTRFLMKDSTPAHINMPFRKPLEFSPLPWPETATTVAEPSVSSVACEKIVDIVAAAKHAKRGVLVAGPADPADGTTVCAIAEALGLVLLAEASSNARFRGLAGGCLAHNAVLDARGSSLDPDLVLRVGGQLASTSLSAYVDRCTGPVFRLRECSSELDASKSEVFVKGSVQSLAKGLEARSAPLSDFHEQWRQAHAGAHASWTRLQELNSFSTGELAMMHGFVAALPENSELTLGNSLVARTIDDLIFARVPTLRVLHQRGVSGIDGLIAGAVGAARVTDAPCSALLIGDVAFAHDVGSLALAANLRGLLVIALIDNGGGQIFSQLPIAEMGLRPEDMRYWTTPPNAKVAALCDAYGLGYQEISDAAMLGDAVADAVQRGGAQLLHCRAVPNSAVTQRRGLYEGT